MIFPHFLSPFPIRLRQYCLAIGLLCLSHSGIGQGLEEMADSLRKMNQPFFLLADSSILVSSDTVLVATRAGSGAIGSDPGTVREEELYAFIKASAYRNPVTRELYHLIFRSGGHRRLNDSAEVVESQAPFLWYEGQFISGIRIIRLDPFGRSVEDTSRQYGGLLAALANRLHIGSRERVIRENLIFRKGDAVSPRAFADTERLLRALEMIRDARISLRPADGDSVEVDVVVQDAWAVALDARVHNPDSVSGQIYYRNLFGYGQVFENELAMNLNQPGRIAYRGSLEVENLFGSFVRARLAYSGLPDYQVREAGFEREFVAEKFRFAGGLFLKELEAVIQSDSLADFPFRRVERDVWAARSFGPFSFMPEGSHFTGAFRFLQQRYFDHPERSPFQELRYYDRNLILAGLAFTRRNYYTSQLIYSPGTTEDIPFGFLAESILGREFGEFRNRWYGSVRVAMGDFYGPGYGLASLGYSGFFHPAKQIVEEGIFFLKLSGFSRLRHRQGQSFRHFAGIELEQSTHPLAADRFSLEDREGIRGLKSPFLRGYHKAAMQWESVMFHPGEWMGFSYAIYGFTDLGVISDHSTFMARGPWYAGLGAGFRIYNENLFFRAFQIRLTWYPRLPEEASYYLLALSGLNRSRFEDFSIKKPAAGR